MTPTTATAVPRAAPVSTESQPARTPKSPSSAPIPNSRLQGRSDRDGDQPDARGDGDALGTLQPVTASGVLGLGMASRPEGTRAALAMDRLSPHRRSPPENGGRLAFDLRPRPISTRARIASWSAGGLRHVTRPHRHVARGRGLLRCCLLSRLSRSSRFIRSGTVRGASRVPRGDEGSQGLTLADHQSRPSSRAVGDLPLAGVSVLLAG
jgi:hypothetical protein